MRILQVCSVFIAVFATFCQPETAEINGMEKIIIIFARGLLCMLFFRLMGEPLTRKLLKIHGEESFNSDVPGFSV